MATQIYKGFYQALDAGSLTPTPDIRAIVTMTGFSATADAINLDDVTLDEFDGSGYVRLDIANPTGAYVDADDAFVVSGDDGSFGDPVGAGSDDPGWLVIILHVDGTAANDIILASTDTGIAGAVVSGGAMSLVVPAEGLIRVRTAD
jgi:hypothetical protein